MLTGKSLRDAMGYSGYVAPFSESHYAEFVPEVTQALLDADCTTNERAAMFLAQIGAESGSLRWMEELASGKAYEGRKDLGNTQPGDGVRFKGRGPIQVTGRNNYAKVSLWAHKNYPKRVPTSTYFVDHPTNLAMPEFRWLGAVWYWTVARDMNKYADAKDIRGATHAVNGGYNNLAGRTARWKKCLTLGDAIVPKKPATATSINPPKATTPLKPADPKPVTITKPVIKPTPKPAPAPTKEVKMDYTDTLGIVQNNDGKFYLIDLFNVRPLYTTAQVQIAQRKLKSLGASPKIQVLKTSLFKTHGYEERK